MKDTGTKIYRKIWAFILCLYICRWRSYHINSCNKKFKLIPGSAIIRCRPHGNMRIFVRLFAERADSYFASSENYNLSNVEAKAQMLPRITDSCPAARGNSLWTTIRYPADLLCFYFNMGCSRTFSEYDNAHVRLCGLS